ncbi:MAG: right-handed parallel beta-helix repeat-containing protein [bacterium]|nr:right-handed parallel beta-helix repeat-containing protein [bacterium]
MDRTLSPRFPIRLVMGLALATAALPAAAAARIACGDVLPPGTTVVLTQDVGSCDGGDWALAVDGAVLDLNGHTFSCADTDGDGAVPDGIVLFGRGAVLRNGTVRGCYANVFLAGRGGHLVEDVVSTGAAEDGVHVQPRSNRSRIQRTTSNANADDGFELRGSRNRVEGCVADDNGEDGIDVAEGARNTVVSSAAARNVQSGIDVGAPATRVLANTVRDNGGFGIEVRSRRNRVLGNTASGSGGGPDIVSRRCRGNRFRDNVVAAPGVCVR